MNFIWLKSQSGGPPELPRRRNDSIVLDHAEDPARAAARYPRPAIVVEVRNVADAERAIEVIDELSQTCPIWIYQPGRMKWSKA